jgi:hypothetical protein
MNRIELAKLKFLFQFNFLHLSVGHLLMITSLAGKNSPNFTYGSKLEALTVPKCDDEPILSG